MAVEIIQRLAVEIGANIKAFTQRMAKVTQIASGVKSRLGGLIGPIASIGKSIGNAAKKFRESVFSMKGALIAAGIGIAFKRIASAIISSFGEVATTLETAEQRLVGIKGGVEEAAKTMQFFQKVASGVAFSLQDIIEAGVTLEAFGSKSEKSLEAVTDLAAFMGVDVKEAASAFGRAFAGGAGAADILRERGVLTMVKLRAGVDDLSQLSLPEFREALFSAMVDPTGPVAGAAKRLADTWTGQISFMEDAWFNLRKTILDAGLLDLLKEGIGGVTQIIKGIIPAVEEFAKMMVQEFKGLASASEISIGDVIKFIKGLLFTTIGAVELMKTIWNGLKIVWEGIKAAFFGVQSFFVSTFIQILSKLRSFISTFAEAFDQLFNTVIVGIKAFGPIFIDIFAKIADEALILISGVLADIGTALSKIPKFAGLAAQIQKVALASAQASEKVESMGVAAKAAISIIKGFDPARTTMENIDNAIGSLGITNEALRKQLQTIKAELDGLAESEAIPFWERAKAKILELNAAIIANEEQLKSQATVTTETAEQNQTKIGETVLSFQNLFKQMLDMTKAFTSLVANAITQMASGIGNAVGRAIVFGENMAKSFSEIFKELAASIIAQLVQIIITALIANALLAALGLGGGPNISGAIAGAKKGGELIKSSVLGGGAAFTPLADGGIVTRPTAALIGEGGPEAVIPLGAGGGMMGGRQKIVVMLDSEVLTEAVVTGMPEFVRISTGSEF